MNKVHDLAEKYYIAILEYEYYISLSRRRENNLIKVSTDNPEIYLNMYNLIQEMHEKDYMPWRLIKGDLKKEIENIFEKEKEKIPSYLRICDGVWDDFYLMLEYDLTKHYKQLGQNIEDKKIKEEISDIACDISSTTNLDSKIYSEDTLNFQKIVHTFSELEDKLFKLYKGENDKEFNKEQLQNDEIEY